LDSFNHLLNNDRRQSFARFVDQEQFIVGYQRPRYRQHLLLPTREIRAGQLDQPLQIREQTEDKILLALEIAFLALGDLQVFQHAQVAEDGAVLARDPSAPQAQPEEVARIKLVSPGGSRLVKGVDSFLKVPGADGVDGVLPPDPTARVTSGALEGSNVETAETLVDMIDAQRAFEQRARIIKTARELDEASARLMDMR